MSSFFESASLAVSGGEFKLHNGDYVQLIHQDLGAQKGDILDFLSYFYSTAHPIEALDTLQTRVASGASFDSEERYDGPKCHPDTRIALLDDLITRVTTAIAACMIWLYGPAGAGKSAIAQSVAERCANFDQALLVGSFFFFRASTCRNTVKPLGATLIYQLIQSIPSTRPHVLDSIIGDPRIFDTNLENQLMKLFIDPLRRACQDDPTLTTHPRLIIIDGLDECGDPKTQKIILTAFEQILRASPIRLVILVVSRAENHIQSSFDIIASRFTSSVPVSRIALNDQTAASDDIRLFLNAKFSTIRRTHPLRLDLPVIWPFQNDIDTVVAKSSGQFIYAATIVRYVESDQHNPQKRLQAALDAPRCHSQEDSPFAALDALYSQIFSAVNNQELIVTLAILNLRLRGASHPRTITPNAIEYRLGLEPGTVRERLSPLTSLVKIRDRGHDILVFHASLEDFLFDPQRSRRLHADQPAVHAFVCKAYLPHVFDPDASIVRTYRVMEHWIQHARKASQGDLLNTLDHLLQLEAHLSELISQFPTDDLSFMDMSVSDRWGAIKPDPRFHDLILLLHEFRTIVESGTDGWFWSRCIEEVHLVLSRDLSVFSANRNMHAFLAFIAFMDDTIQCLPSAVFANSLGVTLSQWQDCYSRFSYPRSGVAISLPFSRTPNGSVDLCSPEDYDQNRGPMNYSTIHDDVHWWGIRGLTSMLKMAHAKLSLIKVLKRINWDVLPYPEHAFTIHAKEAAQAYCQLEPTGNFRINFFGIKA